MKSLLLYLALVGVPVAGLLGILEAGSRLQAPRDVAGEWYVEALAFATPGEQRPFRVLRISQSGVYLSVSLDGGEEVRGRLLGDSLRVVRAPSGDAARGGCASAGWLLRGTFDFAEEPGALDGHVIPPDGSRCAGVSFSALNDSIAKREDRIH